MVEDSGRHAGISCYSVNDFSADLVDEFCNVRNTSAEGCPIEFELLESGEDRVPSVDRSHLRHSGIHLREFPGVDPFFHVSESHGTPGSVKRGRDGKGTEYHDLAKSRANFFEEHNSDMPGGRGPRATFLHLVEHVGDAPA